MTKKSKSDTWVVRGVSPETRLKVKAAAKKARKTMGTWVDEVLMREATETLKRKQKTELPIKVEDLQTQFTEMQDTMQQLLAYQKQAGWKKFFGVSPKVKDHEKEKENG